MGGGARSDAWAQLLASGLACPLHRPQGAHAAAALGAARLAWLADGGSEAEVCQPLPLAQGFEPVPALSALLTERYLVVLPPDAVPKVPGSLQALGDRLPFLGYSTRSTIGAQIDAYLSRTDPLLERRCEFDATDPLLGLVAAGLGFALTTPLCLWQSRHHALNVRVMPLSAFRRGGAPYPLLERRFSLLSRAGEQGSLPAEVATLVRVAVRQLKRQMMPALKLEPSALAAAAESRRQPS